MRILFALLILLLSLETESQVVVNEIIADNLHTLEDPDFHDFGDWIELYNASNSTVILEGYFLSDDSNNKLKWQFPANTSLPAKSFLIVWCDNHDVGMHTNFKLGKSGESVLLSDPNGIVLDQIEFGPQTEDVSYGRQIDGSDQWVYFQAPTPGASNAGGGSLICGRPVFSLESGFYAGSQSLSLEKEGSESKIFYTLDGSIPTESSTEYTLPIQVDSTLVVRAIQTQPGKASSEISNLTLFINETTSLPVFSLITDPRNLFDPDSGIYVKGSNYVWGWGNGNFWQDWERQCNIQFWETDRKLEIDQGAGMKITGSLTRTASQKTLRFIARSQYGKTRFDYRFFKDKEINSFNEFVLRSSGNDWARTMMGDGLRAALVAGQMDIDYNAYRPAILFINGRYWGIHNIREKLGNDYLAENHGVDKKNLDVIEKQSEVLMGDYSAYDELISFVRQNDMSIPENFAFVEERMDVDEYLNYYVAQVYYANHDWPAGNIKFWRPRIPKGKFRWILFDTDLAFSDFWKNTVEWVTDPNPLYPGSTDLFRLLMNNPGFSQKFLLKMEYHMATTFSQERVLHVIDSLSEKIAPEISRHINRWYGYHGWTFTTADGVYLETPWLESYESWQGFLQIFRNFANQRPGYMAQFLTDYYKGGEPVELQLAVEPAGSGKIQFGQEWSVSGPASLHLLRDQKVAIEAVANYTSQFTKWIYQPEAPHADTMNLVYPGDTWRYLDTGVDPGNQWMEMGFDDSSWPAGCATLGYNDPSLCTTISYGDDPNKKHISYLFRLQFSVEDADSWAGLLVDLVRDDGAVVYLNGAPVVISNMPDSYDLNTLALTGTSGDDENKYFHYEISADYLLNGPNILAVEVHQVSPESSDLSFNLGLRAITKLRPGGIQIYYGSKFPLSQIAGNGMLTAEFHASSLAHPLRINEVMPINKNYFSDRQGYYRDWIEIYNLGSQNVDLGGLYLTDNMDDPGKWRFPGTNASQTQIGPGDYKLIWVDNQPNLGPDHVDFNLSGSGEFLGLSYFAQGEFHWIDSMFFPALSPDYSFGRYPDGSESWMVFTTTQSPGQTNYLPDNNLITGLYINELMARNSSAYLNSAGMFDDWIELYNANDIAVNVGGLYLTDHKTGPDAWQIPDSNPDLTTIDPGGFLILIPSARTELGILHTNFQLAGNGEFVGLVQKNSGVFHFLDSVSYPPISTDISFGRKMDGHTEWIQFSKSTPGFTNNSSSGVLDFVQEKSLKIYPNPTSKILNLQLPAIPIGDVTIRISNLSGQVVWHRSYAGQKDLIPNIQIRDLSQLESGIYFIFIRFDEQQIVERFVLLGE